MFIHRSGPTLCFSARGMSDERRAGLFRSCCECFFSRGDANNDSSCCWFLVLSAARKNSVWEKIADSCDDLFSSDSFSMDIVQVLRNHIPSMSDGGTFSAIVDDVEKQLSEILEQNNQELHEDLCVVPCIDLEGREAQFVTVRRCEIFFRRSRRLREVHVAARTESATDRTGTRIPSSLYTSERTTSVSTSFRQAGWIGSSSLLQFGKSDRLAWTKRSAEASQCGDSRSVLAVDHRLSLSSSRPGRKSHYFMANSSCSTIANHLSLRWWSGTSSAHCSTVHPRHIGRTRTGCSRGISSSTGPDLSAPYTQFSSACDRWQSTDEYHRQWDSQSLANIILSKVHEPLPQCHLFPCIEHIWWQNKRDQRLCSDRCRVWPLK